MSGCQSWSGAGFGWRYGVDDGTADEFNLHFQGARSVCVEVGASRTTLRHYDHVSVAARSS